MENRYAAAVSGKGDAELLQILRERAGYEAEAILAAADEAERRNLPVPNLGHIKQDALHQYTLQQ
ncbi:hypothetical protein [Pontibacter roseus]|uniref:hypothetical protein n=1 Tax=Pontibacter roseus TaxID=336989 RepID=UPI00036A57AA|nr:hypothetical protein [Pontibacter roseus]